MYYMQDSTRYVGVFPQKQMFWQLNIEGFTYFVTYHSVCAIIRKNCMCQAFFYSIYLRNVQIGDFSAILMKK